MIEVRISDEVRAARDAGRIPQRLHATASTAEEGTAEFVHPSDPARAVPGA